MYRLIISIVSASWSVADDVPYKPEPKQSSASYPNGGCESNLFRLGRS